MAARVLLTAFSVLLVGCSAGSESQRAPDQTTPRPSAASQGHPNGVILDCSMRSMADFGPAFSDPRNLVVGPLLLVGGTEVTSEAVVLAHDGQKFPLLVKAGHAVTVDVPSSVRKTAGLAYGPFPEGRIQISEAHDTITFVACGRDESSESSAGGPVTFWSGFVMTSVPRCLPLDVYVDEETAPRRVEIALGAGPCKGSSAELAAS